MAINQPPSHIPNFSSSLTLYSNPSSHPLNEEVSLNPGYESPTHQFSDHFLDLDVSSYVSSNGFSNGYQPGSLDPLPTDQNPPEHVDANVESIDVDELSSPVQIVDVENQTRLVQQIPLEVHEISKLNYQAFGDVVAFDATYHTNKYNMIFVPFTGVDHHKRCVTFGAGLLHNETIESYKWLLEAFLTAHKKQPALILTDQDPSMRQAVLQVFTESRHRLCMWHIMKKLPVKISSDLLKNTNIRSRLHRLVWNLYIKVETFEDRWKELINEFGLQDNDWLTDMYAIRDRWVPAFFREIPMCCLMKTTSRCESSNAAFKVNSTSANTLVQFMLCYDSRIEHQRYSQRLAEFKTSSSFFQNRSGLSIEKHAWDIYTNCIFQEVQKEILKGKFHCYISNTEMDDDICAYFVTHLNKRSKVTNTFQVKFDASGALMSCSCRAFVRLGYLCRHVFCVFRMLDIEKIPDQYVSTRWKKDILPKRVFLLENRHGVDNSPQFVLRNEILQLITDCVDVLRCDNEGLTLFAEEIREIKSKVVQRGKDVGSSNTYQPSEMEDLLGQPLDCDVSVFNPEGIRNKGCGKNRRLIGTVEKNVEKATKATRLCRTCFQHVTGHDSRNCPENKKFQNKS